MNNIRSAEIEELYASARKISDLADNYRSRYVKMYDVIHDLGSAWQGYDADTFYERIGSVRTKYDQMYAVMVQYSEFIRSVAERYERQSEEIAREAAGLVFE